MKVSLNWLKELINIETINVDKLANQLTQAGFEVECIETININNQIDYVLDITSTANRSDVLSMIGIAREVLALTRTKTLESIYSQNGTFLCKKNNKIDKQTLLNCSNYRSAIIDNITLKNSPGWLKNRLQSSGFSSKNLILDISNYIMLKWGQPINIIDFNKIVHNNNQDTINISSNFCSEGQKSIKCENVNIDLNRDILVTQINQTITSVAGIGINNKFSIDENTQSIFIEAAIFKQSVVRKSSRNLGIRTESSIRQERGLNADNWENAYFETLSLILELAGGKVRETFSQEQRLNPVLTINISFRKIKNILGPIKNNGANHFLTFHEIKETLEALNFNVCRQDENTINVSIPNYRKNDVFREIDIIEEIARVYGYDKFKSAIPQVQFIKKSSRRRKFIDKNRSILRSLGLTELVHYSLVKSQGGIDLNNPLIQDYSTLRSSLIAGLIQSSSYNIKQSNQTVDSFEIGTVFNIVHNKISETTRLAAILGGNLDVRSEWSQPAHALNWYEAKGIIENFFHKVNRKIRWEKRELVNNNTNWLQDNKSAALIFNGNVIGLFGELNQATCAKFGFNTKLFVFEIDLDVLEKYPDKLNYLTYQVKPYSKYPSITRDLSIIVPKSMEIHTLLELLTQFDDNELENTTLFDEYRSKSLGKDKKSIGLRFTYRSNKKTLTNSEVDNKQNLLQEKIIKQLNLKIRK